jgi:hypothetical protein
MILSCCGLSLTVSELILQKTLIHSVITYFLYHQRGCVVIGNQHVGKGLRAVFVSTAIDT